MTVVDLYSKEDCHLCETAKEIITRIRLTHFFEFNIIQLHERHELFEELKDRIPVVYINHEFAFQYRVPEAAFIQKIRGKSSDEH